MISLQTMRTFYRACGYSEIEANDRAHEYLMHQTTFNTAMDNLKDMAEEDEQKLSEKDK